MLKGVNGYNLDFYLQGCGGELMRREAEELQNRACPMHRKTPEETPLCEDSDFAAEWED